jgi:predicted metal-dependent phosphoesterase TrpH
MRADLHIHTTASDGCWPPEHVAAEARGRSIDLFAIADHDTVAGVPAAQAAAREAGLAFLRGVEVSTCLDGHLFHILAYGFDLPAPTLAALLRENRARMSQRNESVIHHMIAAGYPIDLNEYTAYQHNPARGGWRTLSFLVDHGFCTDVWDYINNLEAKLPIKKPQFPHPGEAIATIRKAGGVPILAHPGFSLDHGGVTEETLRPLLDCDIAGLECYSQYHDEPTTRFCLDWCVRHDLLVTGGSDCHGGFVRRELGIPAVDTADMHLGELEERIIR